MNIDYSYRISCRTSRGSPPKCNSVPDSDWGVSGVLTNKLYIWYSNVSTWYVRSLVVSYNMHRCRKSGEVRGGQGRLGEVRGGLGRSGEVWGGQGRSAEVRVSIPGHILDATVMPQYPYWDSKQTGFREKVPVCILGHIRDVLGMSQYAYRDSKHTGFLNEVPVCILGHIRGVPV